MLKIPILRQTRRSVLWFLSINIKPTEKGENQPKEHFTEITKRILCGNQGVERGAVMPHCCFSYVLKSFYNSSLEIMCWLYLNTYNIL